MNSVTSVNGFCIPFSANGVGRSSSSSFSSAAASDKNKLKKTVKAAVAVRDNPVDSSSKPAAEEIENVDLGKTGVSEESKSDKQDSKVNASKKKKKKPLQSKKDIKVSAAIDSSQVVAEEVSRKSSSKGKKTNVKVSSN